MEDTIMNDAPRGHILQLPSELILHILELSHSLYAVQSLASTCMQLQAVYSHNRKALWAHHIDKLIEPLERYYDVLKEHDMDLDAVRYSRKRRNWKAVFDKNSLTLDVLHYMPHVYNAPLELVGRDWHPIDWRAQMPRKHAQNGTFNRAEKYIAQLAQHGVDPKNCIALAERCGQDYWVLDTLNAEIWDVGERCDIAGFFADKAEALEQHRDALPGIEDTLEWLDLGKREHQIVLMTLRMYGWPERPYHKGYDKIADWVWDAYPCYRQYFPERLFYPMRISRHQVRKVVYVRRKFGAREGRDLWARFAGHCYNNVVDMSNFKP